MPTYEYECTRCGVVTSEFKPMSAPRRQRCPACRGKVQLLISGGLGVVFKGDGFYINDSRKAARGAGAKSKGGTAAGGDSAGGGQGADAPAGAATPAGDGTKGANGQGANGAGAASRDSGTVRDSRDGARDKG